MEDIDGILYQNKGWREKNGREIKEIHGRDRKKKKYELRRERWSKMEEK